MAISTITSPKQIKELLSGVDMVSKNKSGNYIARWTFFYTNGKTSEKYAEKVKSTLPGVKVINSGEHWAPFRGGASIQQSSHFWVEFTFEPNNSVPTSTTQTMANSSFTTKVPTTQPAPEPVKSEKRVGQQIRQAFRKAGVKVSVTVTSGKPEIKYVSGDETKFTQILKSKFSK